VICISALDHLRIYSMAWSEPLFLLLTFGGLLLLDFYIEIPSALLLLGAAVLSAAAALTRYAGIAGVGAGMLILFFCQGKPALRKVKESAIFGVVSGLPVAAWFLRNFLLTHDATSRKFIFHPVWAQIGHAAQSTLSLWLFQGWLPLAWAAPVGFFLIICFGILWMRSGASLPSPHVLLPLIYSFSFILLMAVVIFFFEAQLLVPDEYDRILCPLHIAFLLAVLTALPRRNWPRTVRNVFAVAAIAAAAGFVYAGVGDIKDLAQDGQEFASLTWRTSPTIDYVRRLPPGMHVYTNGRTPIYLYANRACFEFPPKTLLSSLEPNADYQKVMATIAAEVRQGIAVVVGFTIEDLPQFASAPEWEILLHKSARKTLDGYIFAS
jgi:hypothetical protein